MASKWSKQKHKRKAIERDTWDLCEVAFNWLLIRLKQWKKSASKNIVIYGELAHQYTYKDKVYSEGELVDMMITCGDRVNWIENNWWKIEYASKEEEKVGIDKLLTEQDEKAQEFWEIWALCFRSVWW